MICSRQADSSSSVCRWSSKTRLTRPAHASNVLARRRVRLVAVRPLRPLQLPPRPCSPARLALPPSRNPRASHGDLAQGRRRSIRGQLAVVAAVASGLPAPMLARSGKAIYEASRPRHRPNPPTATYPSRSRCAAEWFAQSSSSREAVPHRVPGRECGASASAPCRSSSTDLRRPQSWSLPGSAAGCGGQVLARVSAVGKGSAPGCGVVI